MSEIKFGVWKICLNNNIAVCPECGIPLEKTDIKACETGYFYCSDSCAEIHVKENAPEDGY